MTPEYLAGLFDGEGCIDVQKMYPSAGVPGRLYVRPRLRMAMAANAKPLLDSLQKRFGGHMGFRASQNANQQNSYSLEWLSQDDMLAILDTIEPHLILKLEQARLVRWWLDNLSGKQRRQRGYDGIDQARRVFSEHLSAMKSDPQRLSERAVYCIKQALMRQSDLHGDMETPRETIGALAS